MTLAQVIDTIEAHGGHQALVRYPPAEAAAVREVFSGTSFILRPDSSLPPGTIDVARIPCR